MRMLPCRKNVATIKTSGEELYGHAGIQERE